MIVDYEKPEIRAMKVAVPAEGTDCSSPIDPLFARARRFLIIDLGNDLSTVRCDPGLQRTPHLAGTQASGLLISMDVDAVITMNIGPRAFATFKSANVRVFQAESGTVGETVDRFQAGQLVEFTVPNVEEYWTQPCGARKKP